ncbi:UvrD-helicase domain-containing protein [Methanobrevibacter thaueri]|uniref:DNA 3'-5' helicase n=1 Tax=Methanobrevibacter thaueri TaxID=190975 RepID=A0A315XNV8_9EURY|nr:ATP-dependent helicase [Methanobrevibacter thaueri]PWB88081.1 ATP-dependent DNA helicase PcrA [Methanobrevibacter thaueri]
MDNIKLNDKQKEVVFSDFNTSKIISAPPGAGKTTIMAKRIGFLINQGYIKHPYKILALTFSKAASNEMKKKISDEMRFSKDLFHITTFHGFCFDVLNAYGNYIGLNRNFEMYTYNPKYNPRLAHAFEHFGLDYDNDKFNEWKLKYVLKCGKNDNEQFLRILKYYYDLLIENNMMDYDGLLIFTYKLFKNHEPILEYYGSPFKIILVDEFQDTNSLQFKILDLMVTGSANNKKNIFIFTDPKQSIYGFQGADYKNHERAIENFNCKEAKLSECHRFENKAIEQLSKSISNYIDGNRESNSELTIKENLPKYFIFNENQEEYEFIINQINDLKHKGVKYENICILSPTKKSLNNIINMMKLLNFKNFIFISDYKDEWDVQIRRLTNLGKNDLSEYKNLHDMIISNLKIHNYFKEVILKESKKIDMQNPNLEIENRLSNFINHMIWNYDNFFKNNNFLKDKVFLSTIHGSKGMQFDVSFVCNLNSGSIPFYKDCQRNCYKRTGELNKESLNLLNVAVSRSKKQLYLTSTRDYRNHETCILKPFYKYLEIIK